MAARSGEPAKQTSICHSIVMASLRRVAVSGKFSVKVTKWHVEQGQEVARDTVLASYTHGGDANRNTSERKLKSRFNGKVTKILVRPGEDASPRFDA